MEPTLYEDRFVKIFQLEEATWIIIEWKPETVCMKDQEFQEILRRVVDILMYEVVDVDCIVVDATKKEYVLSIEIQDWYKKEIVPQHLEAGIKRIAFIENKEIVVKLSIEQTFDHAKSQVIDIRFFTNMEEVLAWILKEEV